jgi:hypothetical protein
MKYKKTLVGCDNGTVYHVDTIEHQGKLWLVPEWLASPDAGWTKPARIVRLDTLHHDAIDGDFGFDYILIGSMPKAVLDGQLSPETSTSFEVIEKPDISFETGGSIH